MSIGSQNSQAGKPSLTAADELSKRLSPYTFPVYLLLDNDANEDTVEHIGSGFLISHRGMNFFVTAGHVFDHRSKGRLFYYVSDDKIEFLDRTFETTPSESKTREDDFLDIAVIIVNPKIGEGVPADGYQHQCIPENMVHRHRAAVPKCLNTIVGFPLTRNKVYEVRGNELNPQQLIFHAKQNDDSVYKKARFNKNDFYLARFKENNVVRVATGEGGVTNLKPKGISGGTCWGTMIFKEDTNSYRNGDSFLLGIITKHIPEVKSILCTNIEVAYELADILLNRIITPIPSINELFTFSINGIDIPFDITFIRPQRDAKGFFR
ncbi:hypothetical protein [Rahnella sp. ChDrAdgB13]|uniref:hypothetical protein n=1 Tax=Rahnella sp. ChDrAdgB13 TaxID=1850581 RepID=UPI001AD85283|nr:hypothetical protein [Rahnella sp. ChDrAdgB13]